GCVGFDWFKMWDNDPTDPNADVSNRDSNKGMYSNEGTEYTDLTDYMKELNDQKYTVIEFFDAR
ncbi:MAG: agarase, partial [Clostridia bacterium]|nr:agarase [Clostridia bacterium]